jgi:predicted phosphodiesterase
LTAGKVGIKPNLAMRILAISDIHNLVPAVQELRAREANDFDAVVLAGDFGSHATQPIFDILSTFGCPVLYIRGNWDYQIDIRTIVGPNCFHVHNRSFALGEWNVFGLDFSEVDRAELAAKIRKVGSTKSIVVAHDRLTRTSQDMPGVPLFLYGHHHHFEDKTFKGSRFVNVSALGEVVTVRPEGGKMRDHSHFRNVIHGSYVTIEIDQLGNINVTPHSFHQYMLGWEPLRKIVDGKPITWIWPEKPILDAPFKSGPSPIRYQSFKST